MNRVRTANVYADLDIPNADEMQVKAQLASQIGEIIKTHKWKQGQAAEVIGMPQSKVSKMLRGQFRGISEAMMLECLTRLGLDVQIVIGADSHSTTPGRVSVVAA
ncbi:helix-turn-helix transcriptional regulator [Pseudomonas sp. NyZ704]|nr:helix-turn-helix transcriptional regulator [Pseudomonas sp. NyZ704]